MTGACFVLCHGMEMDKNPDRERIKLERASLWTGLSGWALLVSGFLLNGLLGMIYLFDMHRLVLNIFTLFSWDWKSFLIWLGLVVAFPLGITSLASMSIGYALIGIREYGYKILFIINIIMSGLLFLFIFVMLFESFGLVAVLNTVY